MSFGLPPSYTPDVQIRRAPATKAEGHTLTLQLRPAAHGAMSGRVVVSPPACALDGVRVRVTVPPHMQWTFTP